MTITSYWRNIKRRMQRTEWWLNKLEKTMVGISKSIALDRSKNHRHIGKTGLIRSPLQSLVSWQKVTISL